jgi:multidrug efflux pump subunit AcrB
LCLRGLRFSLGGLYAEQQNAFAGLVAVFLAAAALVFFLLLFLYESFRGDCHARHDTARAGGRFGGLWLTGTEMNITSMMGMTMIVGIVTEVSIFYYSEYADIADESDPLDR